MRGRDALQIGPGVADALGQGRVGGDALTQFLLLAALGGHEGRIGQGALLAVEDLEAVLQAEQRIDGDALGLLAGGGVFDQAAAQFRRLDQRQRHLLIAQRLQLGHRQQALGGAGIAGDEGDVAFLGCIGVPGQVVRRSDRLAVFVDPQETGIQGVAGEVEVVRVAAEEGRLELGREDQAHVVILAELVQLVLAAAIEADDLAGQLLVVAAGFLLDLVDLGGAGLDEGCALKPGAGAHDTVGDVRDVRQDFGRLAGAFLLFLARSGHPAVLDVVVLGRGQVLHARDDAVVVGQDQAFARDQRGRTALQAHRGVANPVQPGLIDVGAVFLVHRGDGEVVEGPHPLVGLGGRGGRRQDGGGGAERGQRGGETKRRQGHERLSPGARDKGPVCYVVTSADLRAAPRADGRLRPLLFQAQPIRSAPIRPRLTPI